MVAKINLRYSEIKEVEGLEKAYTESRNKNVIPVIKE